MTLVINPKDFSFYSKKDWDTLPKDLEKIELFVNRLNNYSFDFDSSFKEFDRQRRELNLLKKLTEGCPEASTKLVKLPGGIYHIEMEIPESVLTGSNGATLLKNVISQLVILQDSLEWVRAEAESAHDRLNDVSRVVNF